MGRRTDFTMATEHSLLFVSDYPASQPNYLMDALSRRHRCVRQSSRNFADLRGDAASHWLGIVIDSDLNNAQHIEHIKRGAQQVDRNSCFVVVVVDPYGPIDIKMAMILRADRVVPRMSINAVSAFPSPEMRAVVDVARADFVRNGLEAIEWLITKFSQPRTLGLALSAGETALDSVFSLAKAKTPLDKGQLAQHGVTLLTGIEQHGLQLWLETVRKHHNGTYRHSLAVSGISGTFARLLGFSRADTERLVLAAMLHDIGKAEVPVEILEKATALTEREQEIVRLHPMRGRKLVETQKSIDSDILDVISDHHECLDGTGYPRGLKGSEIGDLTRLMTICDCFANLISRRPPAVPHTSQEALAVMKTMEGRLDMALVHAFGNVITTIDAVDSDEYALA